MEKDMLDEDKLPWIYRLILRLPKASLESAGEFQGVYWAIVIPIFLVCEVLLTLFLLLTFPFPTNLVVAGIIPIAIFVVFVKVQLERFLNWWNSAIRKEAVKWDIKKSAEEYIGLLEKQKSKRQHLSVPTDEKNRKED